MLEIGHWNDSGLRYGFGKHASEVSVQNVEIYLKVPALKLYCFTPRFPSRTNSLFHWSGCTPSRWPGSGWCPLSKSEYYSSTTVSFPTRPFGRLSTALELLFCYASWAPCSAFCFSVCRFVAFGSIRSSTTVSIRIHFTLPLRRWVLCPTYSSLSCQCLWCGRWTCLDSIRWDSHWPFCSGACKTLP